MGSSARKKSEKKKDFQKVKLKVGKSKAKASSVTNTSFAARSIVIKQQSLQLEAPSVAALLEHHLSLVASKQESQRREALAALANDLRSRSDGTEASVAPITIINRIRPCLIDASRSNREQVLRVLKALDPLHIAYNVPSILIYIHIGMVHLAADIRLTSLDVLEWLIDVAPNETVSCAGGWIKTLTTFATLLRWQTASGIDSKGWSNAAVTSRSAGTQGTGDGKLKARQISVLATLLEAGLKTNVSSKQSQQRHAVQEFPVWHQAHHCIGQRPNPFASLGLFGVAHDEENMMHDDVLSRREAYQARLHESVLRGMNEVKREGGEIGRASAQLQKVISGFDCSKDRHDDT